ncbi:hypothetical protein NSERUTF1_7304 [Nocardia seriolae]|nr:hypothetical protein NSERUTF1_7304 [Nocardia seriolae]
MVALAGAADGVVSSPEHAAVDASSASPASAGNQDRTEITEAG